jgi:hypothetical protein
LTSTWIAKEQGFFSKHNIDVQPIFIIATQAAQAMLAGEVQFGLIGPTHVINAVAAGGDMVMIMGNQNRVRYQLIAHPSIKRPEDLKGKTFGIGASMAGLATLAAFIALDHLGLNPRRDNITLLATGSEPSRLAALKGGTTQATVIAPEISKAAIAEGFPVLVDMAKLNIPFQATGLTVMRKFLAQRAGDGRSHGTGVDGLGSLHHQSGQQEHGGSVDYEKSENFRSATGRGGLRRFAGRPAAQHLPDAARSAIDRQTDGGMGINPKAAQVNVDNVVDLTFAKSGAVKPAKRRTNNRGRTGRLRCS